MSLRDRCLIALVGLAALVPFLGQTRDLAAHELRHAEIAREMAESGDFLVPTLFGREYVDKPPVVHAAIAVLYRVAGGPSLALARLPSVVAAVLGALALYGLGLGLADRRAARFAALALLGVQAWQRMARVARPDMVFTAAILASCLAVLHGMRRERHLALAGAIAGLAGIVKGPLGVAFPVLFALVAPLGRRNLARPRTAGWARFGLGLVAVLALWAGAVYLHDHGEYLRRVLTQPDLAWHSDDLEYPVWWYLVTLPVGFLPLTFLLPAVVRDLRARGWPEALVVALAMLALLTVIPKKRPHYVLPVYPFLTLAVAEAVTRSTSARLRALATALVALSIAAGPLYFGTTPPWPVPPEDRSVTTARRVLEVTPPGASVVCFGDLAAAVAFAGRRTNVREIYDARELQLAVRKAGPGAYVVLPEADRETILRTVEGQLALTEVAIIDVPARHGRPAGSRVYRVEGRDG